MPKPDDLAEFYSPEETQRGVEASAFKMGPMPRMGPKAKGEKPAAKPAKKKGG